MATPLKLIITYRCGNSVTRPIAQGAGEGGLKGEKERGREGEKEDYRGGMAFTPSSSSLT